MLLVVRPSLTAMQRLVALLRFVAAISIILDHRQAAAGSLRGRSLFRFLRCLLLIPPTRL
jgi:hypothetical protein